MSALSSIASSSADRTSGHTYAEVIIPLALPKNFWWAIPEEMEEMVKPGIRVEVGLGKNKKYAGLVKKIHTRKPEHIEPKHILNVLDAEPILFEQQMQLWEWMASYYLCSEGEVMAAALPAHFKLNSETWLEFNPDYGDDFSALDHDEFLVAEALLLKKELKLSTVQQLLNQHRVYPVIRRLIDKRVCTVWEDLRKGYVPRLEAVVVLHPAMQPEEKLAEVLNQWSRAPKQMELLLAYLHLLKTEGTVFKKELLKKSGATESQLKGLVEKNILAIEKKQVDRIRYLPKEVHIDFQLSPAQHEAHDSLVAQLQEKPVCLFQGVTSSGKTMIYIKLIEECLQKGRQVLYLLPEIALTAQIIRRLQKHFGGHIGIYHSKFNPQERVEIWNKVRDGELKIILGARSALFLPFPDLGLIIADEEQDNSYKQQDPAPRYNARDAAIFYADLFKASVVLGSATPSVESYYHAKSGKYGWVQLNERYGGVLMPAIQIVDTRSLPRTDGNKIMISPTLQQAIEEAIRRERQVILFQNRRGYTPYQICKTCGWIPHCRNCDVSLTFHKRTHQLHCHYCGGTYPPVVDCAACGNHSFRQDNFGTERIEEQLEELFPKARIARMDIDSVRGKHSHDQLIQEFEARRIDILVGTQMVVKGLDFEYVELVGILDADNLLSFADFRVNERAFQLMEQVSGRAGRKADQGQVYIQATQVKHPILHCVQHHDYARFFETEIQGRQKFRYPPFSRLLKLTCKHTTREVAEEASAYLAGQLKSEYGSWLVGPAEPVVPRVRNQYLMELLLKLPRDRKLIEKAKQTVLESISRMHQLPRLKNVVVVPDADPI